MKSLCRAPSTIRAPVSSTFIGRGPTPSPSSCLQATSQARHPQHRSRSITMNTRALIASPHRPDRRRQAHPFLIRQRIPRMGTEPIPSANRSQGMTRLMLAFPAPARHGLNDVGVYPQGENGKERCASRPGLDDDRVPLRDSQPVAVSGWIRMPGRGAISLRSGFSRFSVCR